MDLPFLCVELEMEKENSIGFNPYSNGSSFFINIKIKSFMLAYTFQSLF